MTDLDKRKRQTDQQRKYRNARQKQGYKRLDIYIPPELWAKLKPHLASYRGGHHPGLVLVELLADIDFGE